MSSESIGIELVEPIEVIGIAGEDPEDFEFVPVHTKPDGDDAEGEDNARDESVDTVLTEGHSRKGKKKCETGDDLRLVADSVRHHADGYEKHEHAVESVGPEHGHGRNVMHRVSGEEEKSPSATDAGAADEAVTIPRFEPHTATQHRGRCGIDERNSLTGAHSNQRHAAEQRKAKNEQDDADLGEEVHAQQLFKRQGGTKSIGKCLARRVECKRGRGCLE